MSRNLNQSVQKVTLAEWVSLSLKQALSETNIISGFKSIGIWPLNSSAVDDKLCPSETYAQSHEEAEGTDHEQHMDLDHVAEHHRQSTLSNVREQGVDLVIPDSVEHEGGLGVRSSAYLDGGPQLDGGPELHGGPQLADYDRDDNFGIRENNEDVPAVMTEDIAMELDLAPHTNTQHYFVDAIAQDLEVPEELPEMEPDSNPPQSITSFLTLPTIT